MICSIRFSKDEQEILERYAFLHSMDVSEVIRKATLEMVENEMDIHAFKEAKSRFDKNPITYSHEEVGKELGFL